MRWQIEDVRAVTMVASVDRRVAEAHCGFCERPFQAASWVSLSVARNGLGGTTIDLCEACTAANWDALLARLEVVAEMFSAAEILREQAAGA